MRTYTFGYYPTPSPAWHYTMEARSVRHLLKLIDEAGMDTPDWID